MQMRHGCYALDLCCNQMKNKGNYKIFTPLSRNLVPNLLPLFGLPQRCTEQNHVRRD
ncbi:hypothetical protein SAMN04488117_101487 [Celeribacter baekdonensis]|uniref:Uncharacterized protein n=1 Tax=Celeribacter baekdonensis TaxID=875171 RepID=A0A1G7GBI8_9RHOB|nr:hypothetical protein SAMN04488117_101487 [Celeribacter baekdonensis]